MADSVPAKMAPKKDLLIDFEESISDSKEERIGKESEVLALQSRFQDTPCSNRLKVYLSKSHEIAKDGAANMKLSLYGAMLSGKEAARGGEHVMEAAKGSESGYGGSDDSVARYGAELSRVNERLSRQYMREQENVSWLMSLLDGLSIPKSSAGTSADVENTSELSNVKFRECEVNEENCS